MSSQSNDPLTTAPSRDERPLIVGMDSGPESPFPIYLKGDVESGFGRGSKELGCPTANLPESTILPHSKSLHNGVLCGYARVSSSSSPEKIERKNALDNDGDYDKVFPMVMSVGWNPYYKNEKKTAEVHIMHQFDQDFYGKELRVVVLAFIRPQYDYVSKEALIEDIETDKQVALKTLQRSTFSSFQTDGFFFDK